MMKRHAELPSEIADVAQLDDLLSTPTDYVIESLRKRQGDYVVLGAAGKMGPSLSRMIRRGLDATGKKTTRVIAVSRFSGASAEDEFRRHGVETIRADLMDQRQLDALPDAPNVVYMVGMKFGTMNREALTWAMNVFLPGVVMQRYRNSRVVAFSSGNVYGLSPVALGGSLESEEVRPDGDYAMSVLGRERIVEHFSRTLNIPTSVIRLNYAVEMRYGVLHDIGAKVHRGEAVDLTMGNATVIWQGDANAMSIAAFDPASSPPFVLNVAGPETISVRRVAGTFARHFGKPATFTGSEAASALLSNGQLGHQLYGYPRVPLQQIIAWTAKWIEQGGQTHGKPTHFETRDGKF
jgi:nucleoside-diphosphate-sugar epimerase